MPAIRKTWVIKLLSLAIAMIIFASLFGSIFLAYKIYTGIFRMSPTQVLVSLSSSIPQCKKIADCKLLPGDILIRRYITSRTWLFDTFTHPYFTHSAFYLGNDNLIEAVGTEKNRENEIQIESLSKSDWLNSDINDFVVIRPKNYMGKLNVIENDLKNIAEDPNYRFGLPKQGYKQTTCADLIFKQLLDKKIVRAFYVPKIITPDYLLWVTAKDAGNFEIVGYNLK